MPIEPGQELLHYRLIEKIGEGGMGVVWKAHDAKLDREVAIKILPKVFSAEPERLTRFKREARLLASLNHPAVAAIYGFETLDDLHFLVLELVPGRGLDEMLGDGPLDVTRALEICRQVIEGLQAAHASGIVHRDLKPGNVRVTPDGKTKVLDFGLARADAGSGTASATSGDSSDSPTLTSAGTQLGVLLGTAAYMSPEQARGRAVDTRSDVWSFGCLLYECLAGVSPFGGATVSDSIAGILEREPDWGKLPATTPGQIRDLLRRCLEKDADRRSADIADAATAIDAALRNPTSVPSGRGKGRARWIAAAVLILAAAAVYLLSLDRESAPPAEQRKMLAVLPFDNMGSAEDEYFADGITEEITARLAGIQGLGVIGRTSATQYKGSDRTVQQIGEELGIDYVLDGTVRWQRSPDATSRVRVTPQLIRVSDATQLWAEVYQAEISDIFEVQSEIAGQVAGALDVALGDAGRRSLDDIPTTSPEAYDYYLRGIDYDKRDYASDNRRIALQMYRKATELDPEFAEAWAALGKAHDGLYWFFEDRSDERLAMAKAAIDRALELDPDLPQAHSALGWYHYHGFLDYERALEEFDIALASLPDDPRVLSGIAAVRRRQGKWDDSLAIFRRLIEIEPRAETYATDLCETLHAMRRYEEAEVACDRWIALAPDSRLAHINKAWLWVSWTGDTALAREVLDDALGNEDAADSIWGTTLTSRIRFGMFDGDYATALDLLSLETTGVFQDDQYVFVPTAQIRAEIHGLMGRPELEREGYESSRVQLEAMIEERPEDARLHSALGIALAGLGRKEDAVRAGERGVELLPVSKEAWRGVSRVQGLAKIYTMVGEHDLAIDRIEDALSIPGELTPRQLQLDPTWRPLHRYPRFGEWVPETP